MKRLKELENLRERVEYLQSEKDELENRLKDNEIIELNRKIGEAEKERDSRPDITLDQWDNDYSKRPTKEELEKVQSLHDLVVRQVKDKLKNSFKIRINL